MDEGSDEDEALPDPPEIPGSTKLRLGQAVSSGVELGGSDEEEAVAPRPTVRTSAASEPRSPRSPPRPDGTPEPKFRAGEELVCFDEEAINREEDAVGAISAMEFPKVRVESSTYDEEDGWVYIVSSYDPYGGSRIETPDVSESQLYRLEELGVLGKPALVQIVDNSLAVTEDSTSLEAERLGLNSRQKMNALFKTTLRSHMELQALREGMQAQASQIQAQSAANAELLSIVRALAAKSSIDVSQVQSGAAAVSRARTDAEMHSGWLHKKGVLNRALRRRYFQLTRDLLSWHEGANTPLRGSVQVAGASVILAQASAPGRFAFELRAVAGTANRTQGLIDSFRSEIREQGKSMHLEAESEAERTAWMDALVAAASA